MKKRKKTKKLEKMVEVVRGFSYKHNLGNYESSDFFCSYKAEVPESQAVEASEKAFAFCKSEVAKSLVSLKTALAEKKTKTFKEKNKKSLAKEEIEEALITEVNDLEI